MFSTALWDLRYNLLAHKGGMMIHLTLTCDCDNICFSLQSKLQHGATNSQARVIRLQHSATNNQTRHSRLQHPFENGDNLPSPPPLRKPKEM